MHLNEPKLKTKPLFNYRIVHFWSGFEKQGVWKRIRATSEKVFSQNSIFEFFQKYFYSKKKKKRVRILTE